MTLNNFLCECSDLTYHCLNRWIILVICILAISPTIYSQNCHCTVEQVQSNTVTPCDITVGNEVTVSTESALWDAINTANNQGGNMTILIEDGTYQIASTASFPYITASNVVFRSLSGNRDEVIIRGGGMVPTSSTEDGFLIAGNYVTIADLTISNVGNHGIQVSGHHLYVHNVKIQDTYEQMIKGSTSANSIDSAIVQCSLLEYTDGIGPNWYIGGLDIHKGKDWIVRDNVFKDISSPGNAVAEHAVHFWDQSLNNTVERNVIVNCDRGIGFGLGTNGDQNEGGIIRNNMIYNNGQGLYNDVGIGLESSPNSEVYNNTVVIAYPNAIEYRFTTTTNASIFNNLTNQNITSRNGGTGDIQTNITDAEFNWFVDASNGDLHLASNQAVVIDQGTDLTNEVMDDIDQNSRPSGSGYDIGAQELLSSGVQSLESDSKLMVYPNPSNSSFTFSSETSLKNATLSFYDTSGKKIKVVHSIYGKEKRIITENLKSGVYKIRLTQEGKTIASSTLVIVK